MAVLSKNRAAFEETTTPETQAPRHVFGLRASALWEIAAFLAILLVVDIVFLAGDRFRTVEPHPFWIVVLLVSVQYGSVAGLVAAASSSAALLAGAMPEQRFDQDFYAYLHEVALLPLLWTLAPIVVGELQGRRIRTLGALRQALAQSEERERVIADAFERVERLKESLEERVAGQLQTVFTTYQAARAIEKTGTGAVLLGIADLVRSVLAPRKFSLFLLNRDVLEASTSEGWTGEDGHARFYDANAPLFRAIVGERRVLCAASEEDEPILGADGVLAGPLVSKDTGAVVGMLKIEDVGFVGLTVDTIANFRLLCEWIGTAYANARRYEAVEESAEQALALPMATFESHAKFLSALSRRAGFPVTVIRLRVKAGRQIASAEELHRDVRDVVGAILRSHDLLFDRHLESDEFDLVLPLVPPEQAAKVVDRVVERLKKQIGSGIDATWTVQSLEQVQDVVA